MAITLTSPLMSRIVPTPCGVRGSNSRPTPPGGPERAPMCRCSGPARPSHHDRAIIPVIRSGRRASLEPQHPAVASCQLRWRRAHPDVVLVCLGTAILAVNLASGGLQLPLLDTDHQNQTLALSFFVLAPVALWVGGVLRARRGWLVRLSRRTARTGRGN